MPVIQFSKWRLMVSEFELNNFVFYTIKEWLIVCFLFSDEIIRKRLLIDGEGTGDDRRITALLRTFLKWCNSTSAEEDR